MLRDSRSRHQEGSATLFVVTLLFVGLIVFLLLGDVAILLGSKLKLGNTADASAMSGASVQAAYLNRIREQNRIIEGNWRGLKRTTALRIFGSAAEGRAVIAGYQRGFEQSIREVGRLSREGARAADEAAREVAYQSLPEASYLNVSHPALRSELADFARARRYTADVYFKYYTGNAVAVGVVPRVRSYILEKPGPTTYFAVGIVGPSSRGEDLLTDSHFDVRAPRFTSYAAAKPYMGRLHPRYASEEYRYRAWLVRIGALRALAPSIPDSASYER